MFVYSEPILKLLFPNALEGSILLKISSISIIFVLLSQTISGAMQGIGKFYLPTIALIFGVISKLIINVTLISIPQIGIYGAAIGTLLCHVVTFLISFVLLIRNIKIKFKMVKCIIKPILATIMMTICSKFVYILLERNSGNSVAIIVAIMAAVITYILAIINLKIFTNEDIYMLPNGEKIYLFLKKINVYK